MMKKFLSLIGLIFVAGLGYGETMDFVTVLSSPVGTFTNLETADAGQVTQSAKVNFSSVLASEGTITLNGATNSTPSLGNVKLGTNASLSSNATEVRATGIRLYRSGALTGSHLLAGQTDVSGAQLTQLQVTGAKIRGIDATDGQLSVLGTGEFKVQSAAAPKLTINRTGTKKDEFATSSMTANSMLWSNDYLTDYTGTTPGTKDYSHQYLLKGRPVRPTYRPNVVNIWGISGTVAPEGHECAEVQLPNLGTFGSGQCRVDGGGKD